MGRFDQKRITWFIPSNGSFKAQYYDGGDTVNLKIKVSGNSADTYINDVYDTSVFIDYPVGNDDRNENSLGLIGGDVYFSDFKFTEILE